MEFALAQKPKKKESAKEKAEGVEERVEKIIKKHKAVFDELAKH